ncbi:ribonuclease H-like domain-containing protein [Tanacetum coccineum]
MTNEVERRADDEPTKIVKENVTKNEEEEPAGVSSSYTAYRNRIRLSLASHSYIYPLGIAEDVLVDVVGYVYPMDFVILYIKEDERRPFILGTPFLTTAKAVIKFDKGTITLKSRKNRLVLEWEEKIKLHQEKEMKRSHVKGSNFSLKTKEEFFKSRGRETAIGIKNPMASHLQQCEDSKIFKLYLTRRSFEVLRKFHWTILGGRSNQNAKESWALLEDLALYDNKSWNDPRDFAKTVKAISLPQDVPSSPDRHLIELKNQVQRLKEGHLAPKQPIQVLLHVRSAMVPTTLSTA